MIRISNTLKSIQQKWFKAGAPALPDLDVCVWNSLRLVLRQGTVDRENLEWMNDSIFWRTFLQIGITEKDTVLDLGSHIGSFGLRAAAQSGCSVWAAEPNHESAMLHRVNSAINDLDHTQTICEVAVSDRDGTVTLHEATTNWAHTTIGVASEFNVLTGNSRAVPCLSLRGVLAASKMSRSPLMKINVEGAEFAFIRGASLEDLSRIGAIVAELHFDLAPGETETGIVDKLNQAGFSSKIVEPAGPRAFLVARR